MQSGTKRSAHTFLRGAASAAKRPHYECTTSHACTSIEEAFTEADTSTHLPPDLVSAIREVYEPAGMKVTEPPSREKESEEYGACRFRLNNHLIVFRIAKTTPTKIGQFVTTWKREKPKAPITPFQVSDGIDFIVIDVKDKFHHGQFIFDQKTLIEKGIMSKDGKAGKLAFRVYPAWTKPTVSEAIKTQEWQLRYFYPILESSTDLTRVCKLFKYEAKPETTASCGMS